MLRSEEEINQALYLFDLWIDTGLIGHMETEQDAQLVYANRELLHWVTGGKSETFDSNITMFQKILTDNNFLKLN